MRKRVLVGLMVLGACGGEAPVAKPPTIASAKPIVPPPPVGARWYFPTPASGVNDRLDLDDGTKVLVGDVGRRETVKDGKATDSPILIPDKLIGSWRDEQKNFIFMADNGDAYVAKDALGAFDVRKGPSTDKITVGALATGKASAMLATSDGKLLRTADSGMSWKPVDYMGGAKVFGHTVTFDFDHAGNGILVHVPQRIFATHDDGATWKPIASPALGMIDAEDDAKSMTFLVQGYHHHYMKLVGDTLTATDATPEKMSTLAVEKPDLESDDDAETTRVIAGSRVFELQRYTSDKKANKVRFRSAMLGAEPGPWATVKDLTSRQALTNLVGAWGSTVVVVRTNDDTDENTPTSTVMTSIDGGASWKASASLEGDDATSGEAVTVGPKGWTFVPALCGTFGDKHEHNCNAAKIRVANGTTFEDLVFTDEFRPHRFAFDDAHDKVYALGMTDSGSPTVYESRLSQNKFTPIAKPVKTSYHEHTRIAVLPDGTLHVFHIDQEKSVLAIERRDPSGKEMPTLYVPAKVELDAQLQGLSVIGARGLAMNGKAAGWETADGGATWTRVATNGAESPDCSDGGCLAGDAQRVGWDLNAASIIGEVVKVAATTDAPADNAAPDDPSDDVLPAPIHMNVACKAAGAGTKLPSMPVFENVSPSRDVFWYLHETDKDGKKTLTIGGRTVIRHETLMDAAPKPPKDVERLTGERSLADGLVAARYSRAAQGPVDVELAAFSLETGHVQHVTLPKLPTFRVARYGFTGEVQLVTGGLLYQATDASQASFIHTDGKIEPLSVPAHSSLSHAQHVGKSWTLLSTDGFLADATFSDNNGASWQEHAWLVTDSQVAPVAFVRGAGGKSWISTALREGTVLYSLASPSVTELPMPIVVDTASCDLHAPYGESFRRPTHNGGKATFDFADKKPPVSADITQRLVQVTGAGSFCSMGYALYTYRTRVVLYRDGKNTFGWAFRTPDDYKGQTAVPLTCTVTP
jgi:hypothetical protein